MHFAFGLHVFCFDASTCNATLWFYILYILLLMCIVSHWKQWHMCFLKTRGEKLQTAFFKTTNKWAFPVFFKCRSLILTQSWHPTDLVGVPKVCYQNSCSSSGFQLYSKWKKYLLWCFSDSVTSEVICVIPFPLGYYYKCIHWKLQMIFA